MRFAHAESEREIDYVRRLAISMQRRVKAEDTLCAETWKNRKIRELKNIKDVARGY